jgi:hypothetical protein
LEKKLVVIGGVFLAFVFCFFVSVSVHAQVTGATLSGTISDASGAVVAGAQVSAKNNATGTSRDVTVDSSGFYALPNLTPGDYEVRISAKGFSTAVQSNLSLAVGQQQQLNFSLKVGETATTVQVTETAPQIELSSSTLTGQVEAETVRELPLNGRDWTQLATLQPGVKRIETQMSTDTSARGNRGFGLELTVSGQRSTFNNYRIDGISVVDYAVAAPGNVIGATLGVDSIQQFSVLTGGFSAEYGRATGGVINAISKSGTNVFHGDAYEFLRNDSLDANSYFLRAGNQPTPEFRRNQFGASAGGPIRKDKTFIFGDYEGLRQYKGVAASVQTVPSSDAKKGTFTYSGTTPPAGCTAISSTQCTVTVNPYAKALMDANLYPDPDPGTVGTGLGANTGTFAKPANQIVPENFYTVKVDHKIGNNDSLFGTYLYDDTNFTQPDALLNDLTQSHTRRQTIAIEENHTFGASFVNTARIGYNRDRVINQATPTAVNPNASKTELGTNPGQTAPRLSPGDVSDMFGGTNSGSYYYHTWNSYQYNDDAFWTHGTHTVKFGAGVERMLYNFEAFQNAGGRWKFDSFMNLMEGVATSFEAGLPQAVTPREFRQTLFGAYVQDDWRFRPNLTLNIGLRYEMTTVLKDAQGKITSLLNIDEPDANDTKNSILRCQQQFDAAKAYGVVAQAGTTCDSVGPYYSNPTLRNFEPRVGFAWDPFRNGKTSVRGGFGIYDVQPLPGYFILQQNQSAPFMIFKSTHAVAGGFSAGNGVNLLTNPSATISPLAASTIEPNPHRSYVMQWNLNMQRQITSDISLTVGYLGSHGVHLMMRGDDGNMTRPSFVPGAGYLFPCGYPTQKPGLPAPTSCTVGFTGGTAAAGGGTSAQMNQALGVIRYIYWNTDSNYHALNVNVDKRFAHGFQFQVAYTWAKSQDDDSQTIAGDTFGNGINSPIPFLPRLYYGPSDFDVKHTISINGLYDVPTPKSWNGIAKTALGGWELGSILSINSGTPSTVIVSDDPLGLGNGGADQMGPVLRVPNCDPYNHGFAGSAPGKPLWINASCFALPQATAAIASSCQPFGFVAPSYKSDGVTVVPENPGIAGTCANLLPGSVGRNNIYGPRLFDLDFSVIKNTPIRRISEAFNIQFRAEMFNITNHDNFVPPQPDSGDKGSKLFRQNGTRIASAGTLRRLATDPREIQLALKFVW